MFRDPLPRPHRPRNFVNMSLISLQLDDYVGVTLILESMPSLETASIKFGQNNEVALENVLVTCVSCIIIMSMVAEMMHVFIFKVCQV
jgi:hypothetical protein